MFFQNDISVVYKKQQSVPNFMLFKENYETTNANVCFEVPCCFEVHIPVPNIIYHSRYIPDSYLIVTSSNKEAEDVFQKLYDTILINGSVISNAH